MMSNKLSPFANHHLSWMLHKLQKQYMYGSDREGQLDKSSVKNMQPNYWECPIRTIGLTHEF